MINVGSAWTDQAVQYAVTKNIHTMRGAVDEKDKEKHKKSRVYLFQTADPKKFFGLKFGNSVPQDKVDAFENLLIQFSSFSKANEVVLSGETDKNYKIVATTDKGVGVVTSATKTIVESIETLSGAASKVVKYATKKAKEKIKQNDEKTKVSENTKWQVNKIKQMGTMAVNVSKSVVVGCVATASQLSDQATASIKGTDTGKKIEKAMEDPKAQAAAKGAIVVGSAAWEIYMAMAKASIKFAEDLGDATADLAEHKYGEDVGEVTRDGLSAVGDGLKAMKAVANAPK
eukprot:UN28864